MKPLITCVCLTEKRVPLLRTAISCFLNQSYPNKELLIVYKPDDIETAAYLSTLDLPDIRSFCLPNEQLSLGERRNMAIDQARGEYFCQWDDDDWCHNKRLEQQMDAILNTRKNGSVLMHKLFFNAVDKQAYFSFPRPWEGTILCKKSVWESGYKYQGLNKEEDTTFVEQLLLDNHLCPVISFPTYIYIFHGQNTWGADHFSYLFSLSKKLSVESSMIIREIVEGVHPHDEASKLLETESLLNEFTYFFVHNEEPIESEGSL